jgi:L-threonylcarbamoyladenylate synthase
MTAELATQVLKAGSFAVDSAVRVLGHGGLAAFPTETVYGLGADAGNGEAVARLFAAKGRPSFNPLIAHVADAAAAHRLARFDQAAERLAAAFWPGPLTLVLRKRADCPVAELATAGLDTIAVRVPSHPVARGILAAFGRPVAAPSANRSGHVSPTTAAHVLADLRGRIELIVDGGPAPMGLESTIIACVDEPILLRPGALPRAAIEQALALNGPPSGLAAIGFAAVDLAAVGVDLAHKDLAHKELAHKDLADEDAALIAPGALPSHYAPRARLRLDAVSVQAGEALLAFGPARIEGAEGAALALNLSPRGDLIEAAAKLFSHLRALDACGAATIAVMPVPRAGLGEAINDRLRRAAAPRYL